MDDRTRNEHRETAAGEETPRNWPAVTALAVDVAGAVATHESQDALTDFLWHMLERDYQIYVCSSTTKEASSGGLRREDFVHPRLTWLTGVMPPSQEQLGKVPALAAASTLWITDDPRIQQWVRERDGAFVSLGGKTASFVADLQIGSWGELGNLLDPTTHTARQVADAVAELRRSRSPGPIVIGIGGPPESGLARLALEVKRALEERSFPLVEVIDVSPLFPVDDPAFAAAPTFPQESGANWLVSAVLRPLAQLGAGSLASTRSLLIEKPPKALPRDLEGTFPLYVSEESVLMLYGETVFHRAIREYLHLAILVEVEATETARRLYGIAEGQPFDASFSAQYLQRDGRAYETYLKANQVVERADMLIDGNSPRRFRVLSGEMGCN